MVGRRRDEGVLQPGVARGSGVLEGLEQGENGGGVARSATASRAAKRTWASVSVTSSCRQSSTVQPSAGKVMTAARRTAAEACRRVDFGADSEAPSPCKVHSA